MFRLNLKIAWRNLWKNKAYSAINIFGLAAGLTGFIIILLYINKETGYDKWDPALKQTYQVGISRTKNGAEIKEPVIDGHFVKMIRERFPQVEFVTRGNWGSTPRSIDYIYNHQTFQPNFNMAGADSLFFKTYPIKALYGKMEDIFTTPKAVAISLTKAKEIFGNINPVNKVFTRKGGANFKDEDLIVKAVWDDQKYRSYFKMSMISATDFKMYGDEEMDVSYSVMLKLHDNTAITTAFAQKINDEYLKEQAKRAINNSDPNFKLTVAKAKEILSKNNGITNQTIIIEPVQNLNLNSFFSPNPKQKSIYVLIALATFLIIISCVNFTNLAIVQATGRAKEVGVKKVLGAFRFTLAKQFLAETTMQCLLAFFIALVSVELLLPTVNTMLDTELTLFTNEQLKMLLLQSLGIVLSIVVLAGLYPALFLSGFMPAKVLKGNFSGNLGTVTLRKGLMILQFTIAGVLVISFLIMNNQLNFMKNKDLGMQADQIMVLSIQDYGHRKLNPAQFSSIKQRLENIKGVMQVSRSTDGIVGEGGWKQDFSYQGKTTQLIARYNDLNYLSILKANILKGRDFSERFIATDTLNNVVINETALKTMGLKQGVGEVITYSKGDKIQQFNVVGVVKDIQNEGFDKSIKPTVYLASDYQWHWRRTALISLSNKNIAETIDQVKKVWKEIEPAVDPSYSFADEKFAVLNAAYERMARVMFSFSTITLLVSILGLFTLAAYTAKIRIKEIAIRKILGASTASILQLLNADLVKLVIVANILGDVFAYIYMNKWFEEFVYRIDMPILPFLMVNLGTIMITILTVSLQSLNAIRANPVNALKYE